MMNMQGRPTRGEEAQGDAMHATFTGNKGLMLEEPLLFEIGHVDATGVDIDPPAPFTPALGSMERVEPLPLPGLHEPEAMRHYVRLSRQNYAIDLGLYPLGSCTMKHNPRLNEKVTRLPGFADIHPLQPLSTVQGALDLMAKLAHYLMQMTGMSAVALSPKAGAHGEMCGLMAMHAALKARGELDKRRKVLVPESAHGTNPATAAALGFEVVTIPAGPDGILHVDTVASYVGDDTAVIMVTNPNTCGLFEPHAAQIAELVHKAGGYFYCDGANFNAIVGKVRPGDLGVDAMHINLHKTFSTPHGGGGPGAGPVVFSERLAPFVPLPYLSLKGDDLTLIEHQQGDSQHLGRLTAFHGQMGMFVRALTYMLSHGSDGMRQASEDAVLSANYIRACLEDLMSAPYAGRPCMHEALFDDTWLKGTGVTTLDIAKALIDEGYHPMTMYFPLVVHGAMLIEPTESESKASLDQFIGAMRHIAKAVQNGKTEHILSAPQFAPRRRIDETRAARSPVLRWRD